MLRPAAALLVLLTMALSGCVTQSLDPGALRLPLGAEPWRENWTPAGTDFTFDLDPAAPMLRAEGTLRIRNDLGHDQGWLVFALEPFTVNSVRDEAGNELSFEVEEPSEVLTGPRGTPQPPLPDEVASTLVSLQLVNVTLTGNVAPGAVRTLSLAYEGWGGRDKVLLAGSAPNEHAMPRINLHPLLGRVSNSGSAAAPSTFTLRHPADWVVLATAEPTSTVEEGGMVETRYFSYIAASTVVMGQGLEWLQEDVGGIDVRTYFYPDMRVQGQTVHDITRHVLTQMPNLTGPYPYRHLWTVPNQVQLNAFSTPGLTFMGLNFYRFHIPGVPLQFSRAQFPVFVPGGQDSYEQVVVHEHTHNWWGHNLRGNNTNATLGPLEGWVTEGVTTYLSELVWMKTQYGEEEAATTARDRGLNCFRSRVDGEERAITEPGGVIYSKTAMSLRALEAYAIQRGTPDAVLDALQLTQERYGRLQGGPGLATSQQVFAVFEEVFGESLAWHFEPWFFGRELSDFRIEDAQRGDGNVTVRVANVGAVPAAVQLKATSASGRQFFAWGFVPGGEAGDVAVALPAGFMEPIVSVEADPYQYVYEWDDTDNTWQGLA